MTEYQKQADYFLKKTNTEFNVEFLKYDYYFQGDKEKRDIYKISFTRGGRSFYLNFGQSLNDSGLKVININNNKQYGKTINTELYYKYAGKHNLRLMISRERGFPMISCEQILKPKSPTSYDVLACLQKYDVGTFENFCSEFGYDRDSISANKTYDAVCKEFENVQKIWTDSEIDELAEIQ